MTKEEALRILDTIPTKGEVVDALEMAIEALEQKVDISTNTPTENDYIRRQDAIDALMSLTVYKSKREVVQAADKHENSWIGGVAECIDEIEDLPSAQHKPDEQIMWERDTAIQQLKELGYGLGEKIRMDGDTISRQDAIKTLCERRCGDKPKGCPSGFCTESLAVDCIPSAQPEAVISKQEYAELFLVWLEAYRKQSAKLHGRYLPFEVLGWAVSDFRKCFPERPIEP